MCPAIPYSHRSFLGTRAITRLVLSAWASIRLELQFWKQQFGICTHFTVARALTECDLQPRAPEDAEGHDQGPKGHINMSILHSGPKAQDKGIPPNLASRILMFMWSFGP